MSHVRSPRDDDLITAEEVRAAARRITGDLHRTPLLSSRTLGERIGRPLLLKAENLQRTGSFKVRGALNRMLEVEGEARAYGVVTVSAGNHAQAVALAARALGLRSRVVMPEDAPRSKVEATRAYGGEAILLGTVFDAFTEALRIADEEGAVFVHPFDDRAVIAGQGTVGLELLEQGPRPRAMVVPVGGGGLLAGVAAAVAGTAPETAVYGVEPVGAASMHRSLAAGKPVRLGTVDTIAEGLGSPMAGERTFRHARALVRDVVTVTDREIRRALSLILSRTKLLVEPAGAAAVAALLAGKIPFPPPAGAGGPEDAESGEERPVVAVLSGGNVDLHRLPELLYPEN